jgi:hypothetical protein
LTDNHQFSVRLTDFEPLSLGGTGGEKYERKKELLKAIERKVDPSELQDWRERFQGKLVKVSVTFFLWKGSADVTDTVFKKDLDNLAKPVLDVLQKDVDEKKTEPGLGLIQNDLHVCVLHLCKELVAQKTDRGMQIVVSEHRDDEMLRILREDEKRNMRA